MDIQFTLSRKEYEEFAELAVKRMMRISGMNRKMFKINVFVWIFFGIGLAATFHFYEAYEGLDFHHLNIALVAWGFWVLGVIAASVYQKRLYLHHSIALKGRLFKTQKVTLLENGFQCQTVDSEQFNSWNAVIDVEHSKNLICLYIDNNQAFLIPKKAFNEKGQLENFANYISRGVNPDPESTPRAS